MELDFLDLIIIMAYFISILIIIYIIPKAKTYIDYTVAKKSISMSLIFVSLTATYIGAGYSMGFIDKGFNSGLFFFILTIGFGIQLILSGKYIIPKLRKFPNCYTVGDVMGKIFGKNVQVLTGLISVSFLIGISSVLVKIGGSILEKITSLSILPSMIVFTLIVTIYIYKSGIRGTIMTDKLQFIFIVLILPIIITFLLLKNPISIAQFTQATINLTSNTFAQTSYIGGLALLLSFLLGETLIPPYVNRALAANSDKSASNGFIYAGVFSIFWFLILSLIGIYGSVTLTDLTTNSEDILFTLASTILPVGFLGLFFVGVISILMSSIDSIINSGAVSLIRDVVNPLSKLGDDLSLILTRHIVVVIAIVSVIVAQFAPSIISTLLAAYSIWVPTVLTTLLIGLYFKNLKMASGLTGMLLGGICSFIWQTILSEPFGIPGILVGILANFIGFYFGQTFGKKIIIQKTKKSNTITN
jgi:SSS family solute:Na+ symporter